LQYVININVNLTACTDFPTGIEVADNTTAEPCSQEPLQKKMLHEDRAPEDDSRTKFRTF